MLLDIQGDMNAIKNTMNKLKKLSDEEKINLPKDVYLRNIFCHDCSLKKTCENDPCENYEYWKEGYEKGLTEGKPKWHDLRKDKTDRPIKDCDVALKVYNYRNHEILGDIGFFEIKRNMFHHYQSACEILAWCELPKF